MGSDLKNMINVAEVEDLLNGFYKATGFVTAILDLDGNILSKSGWRDICIKFHRNHSESAKNCLFSDTVLASKMDKNGGYKVYKCLNGLIDAAVPIMVNDVHVGNIFTGQFFFEKPDRDYFLKQSEKYGFDSVSYMKALDEVPVLKEDVVRNVIDFLLKLTELISRMAIIKEEQNSLIEALKESEKRYKKAQQMGSVGNWEYDIAALSFWGSDEAKRIYGFAADSTKFTVDEVENCIPDRKRVHQALTDLIENDKSYDLVFDIITHNTGEKKTIRSVAELERDSLGKPVKISGVIIDTTDRVIADKYLMESEAKYHALVENLPQRIFSKNLKGEFSTCNSHFANDLKLTPQELLGKTDYDFYPKDVAEKYREDDSRIIKSGKTEEFDEVYFYNGEKKDIHTVKTPLFDENGITIGIMGIFWDVTDKKRNEEELKNYRENLEQIIKDRTKELEQKNKKLEKFNKLFVDREFRIKELKDMIKELEEKLKENGIV